METEKKLEGISKFINEKAKEQKIFYSNEFQEAKKNLKDFSSQSAQKEFTFTVGEMNAYLG